MVVLAPGNSRRKAVETINLESCIHVGAFSLLSAITIRLFVAHPGRVQAAVGLPFITAVTGVVFHLVRLIHRPPAIHCTVPNRKVVGVGTI